MRFRIPDAWRRRAIRVDVAGVGGTGSRILPQLVELHIALRCYNHPGLQVYAWDHDRVTESNVGRTVFAPSDIGNYKATTLIDRINRQYGLMWRGMPKAYETGCWRMEWQGEPADLLITCTDTMRSRVQFWRGMRRGNTPPPALWLDSGNAERSGQIVLGEPEWALDLDRFEHRPRLHHILDLFPAWEQAAETEVPDSDSCTLAVALGRQSLTINRWMATAAFELLWQLFHYGGLDHNVVWVNAGAIRTLPEYRATTPLVSANPDARRLAAAALPNPLGIPTVAGGER